MLIAQRIISNVSVLSKLQQQFLIMLTWSIFCCRGRVNYSRLAQVSGWSEKTFRRHYSLTETVNFFAVHRAIIDAGLARTPAGMRVIAFDPSFLPKAGKKTPGLGRFWNGTASRAERGLEASITAIVEVRNRQAMTLAIQQTIIPPRPDIPSQTSTDGIAQKITTKKTTTKKTTTKKTTTKKTTTTTKTTTTKTSDAKAAKKKSSEAQELTLIDEYLRHVKNVIPYLHSDEQYWVVDGYFAKRKFLDAMHHLKQECITKLRTDANMTYIYAGEQRKGRGRPKVHDGKVEWNNLRAAIFERHECTDGTVLLSAILYHQGLKRRLRVVIVQKKLNDGTVRQIVLASTDLNLSANDILEAYRSRFQVEFLIRDGKGHTGLADSQARSTEAIGYHLNASMLALNCARAEHYQILARTPEATKTAFSIDSMKTTAFNEHFAEMIFSISGLPLEMLKNHPEYQNIRNYGVIAT